MNVLSAITSIHLSDFAAGTVLAIESLADPTVEAVASDLFASPCGLAVAPDGSVLVAETGAHRCALVRQGGDLQRFGQRGSGVANFERPADVAWRTGSMLVIDSGNCRVVEVDDITGVGWRAYGRRGRPSPADPAVGAYADPRGLAVDTVGRIWVSDPGAGRITRIADLGGQGWAEVALPPAPKPSLPYGIAAHGDGVAVVDVANRRAVVLDAGGEPAAALNLAGDQWLAPTFVASAGDLLIIGDVQANALVLLDPQATHTTVLARFRGSPPDLLQPRFTSIGGLAA